MNISLNPAITRQINQFKIGLIHYNKIIVEQSPQMIKGRMQLFQESLYFDLQDGAINERPTIAEWRSIWKTLGTDANRYRHSAESLLRRVNKQNYISPLNSAVDLNNFFSLRYELPIGIYDVAHLKGDIDISVGKEDASYEGLNGRPIQLTNMVHCADANGAFGSPYVDSIRTAVTETSTNALQIFYLRPSLSLEDSEKLLSASANMFTQITGGDYKVAVLHEDRLNVEL